MSADDQLHVEDEGWSLKEVFFCSCAHVHTVYLCLFLFFVVAHHAHIKGVSNEIRGDLYSYGTFIFLDTQKEI